VTAVKITVIISGTRLISKPVRKLC